MPGAARKLARRLRGWIASGLKPLRVESFPSPCRSPRQLALASWHSGGSVSACGYGHAAMQARQGELAGRGRGLKGSSQFQPVGPAAPAGVKLAMTGGKRRECPLASLAACGLRHGGMRVLMGPFVTLLACNRGFAASRCATKLEGIGFIGVWQRDGNVGVGPAIRRRQNFLEDGLAFPVDRLSSSGV